MVKDKIYYGWFFKKFGQEREFLVKDPSQLDYAIELVKHSYELAK